MPQPGKVYLVGAGPGHPELLTIKAAELIKSGDVIIYDRLIQEEVLALSRPSAERIYMGKPVGKHESRQDEVNELLVRKAREGKSVIRLKGGDPFLFGRGGEEAEYLADRNIPFEVIPGVCSALSAPLSAGIPVTHRDAASSVAIVTGHNADGTAARIDWNALARIDTVVFLMGVHNVDKIANHLIEAGRSADTPVAIIQMAFWHDEFAITGTLASIAEDCKLAGIKSPATLVVGEVVRLREKLKNSARDLDRARSGTTVLGPEPDELFALASAGFGSQVLGWGLENSLFDLLEEPKPVCDIAHELRLETAALSEILTTLVALRLLESRPDGYRNLELASRYLRQNALQSLRASLLYQAAQFCDWNLLSEFARHGRQSGFIASHNALRVEAAEDFARLTARQVVPQIGATSSDSVLVVGWGATAYREALLEEQSDAAVASWNPFAESSSLPDEEFGTVVLSGVLEWCSSAELQSMLRRVRIRSGGLLLCCDSLLLLGTHPAPRTALRSLARQVADGVVHSWSLDRLTALLERSGFAVSGSSSLRADGVLVIAHYTAKANCESSVLAAVAVL